MAGCNPFRFQDTAIWNLEVHQQILQQLDSHRIDGVFMPGFGILTGDQLS